MLFAVIGGVIAGACLIFIAWAVYDQSMNVPSKPLVRKWHRETSGPRRP
jgi:hypothetical protein